MVKLFGFEIRREAEQLDIPSFTPRETDDGALVVSAGGTYGTYLDLEGSARTEAEIVAKYREMAIQPEVELAVNDIVSEAIVKEDKKKIVEIDLDDLDFADNIKERISEEWDKISNLLDFNNYGYEIFKRWYIDGRVYYHVMIDVNNPREGIKELRYIDPRKIRKIRAVKRVRKDQVYVNVSDSEFYMYNERGFKGASASGMDNQGLQISKDSILHVTSGVVDKDNKIVLGYLHKAIKPLNQLRILEDATVIYRISRAPERRIFSIDVGNLPKMKAEQYVREVMVKHKNRLIYDATTGNIRDDRKFMCYALDTKIPLLDGRTLTIEEIISEYNEGKLNWVYSCDPKTGKFYPGPISWAGITKKNSDVVRVTFDNGKSVICTPDHKFPVWNKGFIEAKDLAIGESLIPGYRRHKSIIPNGRKYEQIYKNDTKTWEFTHKEIASWKEQQGLKEESIFSFDTKDDPKLTIQCKTWKVITPDGNSEIIENLSAYCRNLNLNRTHIKGSSGSRGYRAEQLHNHKVVSVEFLDEKMTVAALTIDQEETYHSHHTYLLDAGVYTKNTMLEDYWFPRRADGGGTQVTTLPSGQNLGELADVEYFEKKLYQSLNVPVSRMISDSGFSLGRSSEITRDELKFQKFIIRLRTKFSEIFYKALEKQLVLTGVIAESEWDDIKNNIHFNFQVDNYFAELKESEILTNRINTLAMLDPYVGKYYSEEWVRKNILQMTDEDINKIEKQIDEEMVIDVKRQAKQSEIQQKFLPQQSMTDDSNAGDQEEAPQQSGQAPQEPQLSQ